MSEINNSEALFGYLSKTASNIITYFDKDERDNMLSKLKDIAVNNCIYDEKVKKVHDTFKDLSIDDEDDETEILDKKKNELLEYQPDVSNNEKLKQFYEELTELVNAEDDIIENNTNDDDVQITNNAVNVIDPFTKKRMTDPVKNKICGHVYDRESIATILKMKKETRCPVIGCISKQFIEQENLIADIKTRKYLQKNPA